MGDQRYLHPGQKIIVMKVLSIVSTRRCYFIFVIAGATVVPVIVFNYES